MDWVLDNSYVYSGFKYFYSNNIDTILLCNILSKEILYIE